MTNNPANVRPFDLTPLAELPEYNQAAHALNKLVHAMTRADIAMTQTEWLTAVRDMTAGIPFTDMCNHCRNLDLPTAPAKAEIKDGWLTGYYICHCGYRWTCGWSTRSPEYF
ncbi:hypothetical protein [Streptomyces pseudogriseolus]|uniref:hypothetical protein n=1 Tax=Streptomyces pseudogriseolus TaxID=36817 RepID=UPI003FA1EAF5